MADARSIAGGGRPFDEAAARDLVARDVDRTIDVASAMTNHPLVVSKVDPWRDRLGTIRVPTLVMHGTDDPVFPHDDGVALADEIPGAKLRTLDGTGHELPEAIWDEVAAAVLGHTADR